MIDPASPPPDTGYRDRRGALIGVGILVIVVGLVCALLAVAPLAFQGMPAGPELPPPDSRSIAAMVATNLGLAAIFVWLGIGSILARRWARALLLMLSWVWLVSGVFGVAITAWAVSSMSLPATPGGEPVPDAILGVVIVTAIAIGTVAFVLLPGVLILFYRSRHVIATCEASDPEVRWTDRCPPPVLALSVGLGLMALSGLPTAWAYRGLVPFFGVLVGGAPGMTLHVLMTAIWAYGAWATARLKPTGWWIAVVAFAAMLASATITFARVDPIELFRAMGSPESQIITMQDAGLLSPRIWQLCLWLLGLPTLGYVIYLKKYFR